jgi:hypothetical protein
MNRCQSCNSYKLDATELLPQQECLMVSGEDTVFVIVILL